MSIPTPSLREQVQVALTRRIVTGEAPAHSLLPTEPQLAEEFGVSRVVIREAMKGLAARGLVDIKQGRGTVVLGAASWNPMDPQVLRFMPQDTSFYTIQSELLEARMIFETQLAGLAATRLSDRELARIETLLRRMDQTMHDPEAFHLLDAEFHQALVRGANNTIMVRLLEPVHEVIRAGFQRTIRKPGAPQQAQVMHWDIYRALKARDPLATQAAVQRHLIRAQENLLELGEWLGDDRLGDDPASSGPDTHALPPAPRPNRAT